MIDPELQAKLRAKFNPDGSELRKIQLRMLEMLKYIDKICRENNIKYWLSSGTCLGAVRHGGFIPWDDDCDIEMEKKDFRKLCNLLKEDNKYILQDHSTDFEYLATFAKLRDPNSYLKEDNINDAYYKYHGIYIDIFCIEPSSSEFLCKVSSILQQYLIFSLPKIKHEKSRRILIKIMVPLLHKYIFPVFSLLGRFNNKKIYRHISGTTLLKPRCLSDFEKIKYVKFEDSLFPVPEHPEEYLTRIYDDFTNLPPQLDSIHKHIKKIEFL